MTQRYSNVSEVPLALAVFLASDNYDYSNDPNEISATTLLKPIRQIILPSRIPEGEAMPKLADMMNSRMGTAIHDGIENSWKNNYKNALGAIGIPQKVIDRVAVNPSDEGLTDETIPVYLEQRLKRREGKWVVTGKFDFVGEGRVQDFKSTSVFTYLNQTNADKYAWQGSIYRWLDFKMITQDEMDIHYIFTDWKSNMARSDPNYPKNRFLTQTYKLYSLAETGAFIKQKLSQIEQYVDVDEQDIPYCDDSELWRSDPVYKYYKHGDTTAKRSTKNFDTMQDAITHKVMNGNQGAIKEVPGQVMACKYCPAFAACSQKDSLIASGDLLME